ncbi:MAG: hypothetical protein J5503_01145 [Muribaculaceae bacterium]|nr:hypothetical protein [Muribaculaceae bacterium]
MKKLTILLAAVALLSMSACSDKNQEQKAGDAKAPAKTEQTSNDSTNAANPNVNVERPQPTDDGKDKVVAEFADAKGSQIKLENMADGSIHLRVWTKGQDKNGTPEYDVMTKNCVMGQDSYLMQSEDGTSFIVKVASGAEHLSIMNGKEVVYDSNK